MAEDGGRGWRAGLAVAALAAALYLPSLGGDFVLDDRTLIRGNEYVQEKSNLLDVLTLRVLRRPVDDSVRPVYLASVIADAALWGERPAGYRLTSLLLHAANALLLFLLLRRLSCPAAGVNLNQCASPLAPNWPRTAVPVSATADRSSATGAMEYARLLARFVPSKTSPRLLVSTCQ